MRRCPGLCLTFALILATTMLCARADTTGAPAVGSAPAVSTPAPGWTLTQITSDAAEHHMPQLSWPHVIWTMREKKETRVFLYDIAARTTKQIGKAPTDGSTARIAGNFVLYQGGDTLYLYDIAKDTTTAIAHAARLTGCFAVAGKTVAWIATDKQKSEVFLYDISSGQTFQATHDGHPKAAISSDAKTFVWQQQDDVRHVYACDAVTKTVTQISDDRNGNDTAPAVAGDVIVWVRFNPADNRSKGVFLFDRKTRRTSRISNPAVYVDLPMRTDGKSVVWSGSPDGGLPVASVIRKPARPSQIYLYDIRAGTVTQITQSGFENWNPYIAGNLVCWRAKEKNKRDTDVYLFDGKQVLCLRNDAFDDFPGGIDNGTVLIWGCAYAANGKIIQPLVTQAFLAMPK